MNTLVQLLALYTNPESQNAQRHRQTDDRITPITKTRIDSIYYEVSQITCAATC